MSLRVGPKLQSCLSPVASRPLERLSEHPFIGNAVCLLAPVDFKIENRGVRAAEVGEPFPLANADHQVEQVAAIVARTVGEDAPKAAAQCDIASAIRECESTERTLSSQEQA